MVSFSDKKKPVLTEIDLTEEQLQEIEIKKEEVKDPVKELLKIRYNRAKKLNLPN